MGSNPLGEAGSIKVRAFFGLPLPEDRLERLDRYLAACAAAAPQFRWTPAANLHLTIRFLGHVEQALAEGIIDRLAGHDLRAFKRGRLVRVAWLGLAAGGAEIGALAAAVEAETVAAGFEPEARSFNAHLTLARARHRDGAPLPELPDPPEQASWRADELILYRSRLGRAGSVYEPLRSLRLG
jgi:RNA 2',3'-cyclic 3'-phosphodiesterase